MAGPLPSSGRTSPLQKRARKTVEDILDATAQLLGRDGYRDVSTNLIAKHAHLSIGTVYRYFDDKNAIVVALRSRTEDDIIRRVVPALAEAMAMDAVPAARHVLAALVDALEVHQGVLSAVIHELPLGSQSNLLPGIEEQLYHLARLALLHSYPNLSDQAVDEMLYLGMGMLLQVAIRIAVDRPPELDRKALLDRAASLVAGNDTQIHG